jgi:hypothetical protein
MPEHGFLKVSKHLSFSKIHLCNYTLPSQKTEHQPHTALFRIYLNFRVLSKFRADLFFFQYSFQNMKKIVNFAVTIFRILT